MNREVGKTPAMADGRLLRVSGLVFDTDRREVLDPDGRRLDLSPRGWRVLQYLAVNPGRVVPKDELLTVCWPDVIVTEDSLTQCVSEIRKALGSRGRDVIRTVPRQGYMMVPEVRRDEADASAAGPTDASVPDSATADDRSTEGGSSAGRGRAVFALAAAFFAALMLIVGVRAFSGHGMGGPLTLAVVPFRNLSGSADLDYFAAGTTETLAGQLARSPLVRVLTVTPEDGRSVEDLARSRGVDFVLQGAVQRSETAMRLVARLVDASTGENIWGEQFDETNPDPLALQARVARKVVGSIAGERGLLQQKAYAASWGSDSSSLGEYDYYLRGHQKFWQYDEAGTRDAIRIWTEGLQRFPGSSILQVKLGFAYDQLFYLNISKDPERDLDTAWELANAGMRQTGVPPMAKALGHWLLANLENDRNRDPLAAAEHARIAMAMLPYEPEVFIVMGFAPIVEGRPEEALRQLADMDPGSPNAPFGNAFRAWANFSLGRIDAAIATGELARDEPTYGMPILAAAYVEAGRMDDARAVVERLRNVFPMGTTEFYARYHRTADGKATDREVAALRLAGLP